jgi:hypothetical protein
VTGEREEEGVDPWEFFLWPQQHSHIDPVKGAVLLFFKVGEILYLSLNTTPESLWGTI